MIIAITLFNDHRNSHPVTHHMFAIRKQRINIITLFSDHQNPHPVTHVQNARRCRTVPSHFFFFQTPARTCQFCTKIQAYRTTAVIFPAKNGMIQLIGRLLSLVPNADGASECRLINKINTTIGTEPEEADVTQVSVYDCEVIPLNCLYFMVLDLCVIDKTLFLCPSSWSGIHLSDVQFAEHGNPYTSHMENLVRAKFSKIADYLITSSHSDMEY